jgi:hypothetical protein
MALPIRKMNIEQLEARIAAIEVLLLTMAMQMDSIQFESDLEMQTEIALSGLSYNTTASDNLINEFKKRISEYKEALHFKEPESVFSSKSI